MEWFRGHLQGLLLPPPPPPCSVGDAVQTCSQCQRTWPRPTWSLRCGRGWAPAGWSETWGWARSQPAFCGVDRERERRKETEDEARGRVKEEEEGNAERWWWWRNGKTVKQHKHGHDVVLTKQGRKRACSFIIISIKSWINIILLNNVSPQKYKSW